ncbi:Uncharacterised protein [Mycobacteroides abscessus subsp. abscessus]|nr:Uncharacterised protein [Mycobacteroides abscessus subsp. abscessus]
MVFVVVQLIDLARDMGLKSRIIPVEIRQVIHAGLLGGRGLFVGLIGARREREGARRCGGRNQELSSI